MIYFFYRTQCIDAPNSPVSLSVFVAEFQVRSLAFR